MKKLFLISICVLLLSSCINVDKPKTQCQNKTLIQVNDTLNIFSCDTIFKTKIIIYEDNYLRMCVAVYNIKGHEYITTTSGGIIHSESCQCKNKNNGNK